MKDFLTGELALQLLENAGEGILGIDKKGDHTFANPKALSLLGYTIEELKGKHSHRLWHSKHPDGSDFPEKECPIYSTLNSGESVHCESYFWRKDGSGFPAEYLSTPIIMNGEILGAVISFIDISKRIEAEAKIQEERNLLRVLIDNIPDVIYFKDRDCRFILCNDSMVKLIGKTSQEELIGKTYLDLFSENISGLYISDEKEVLKTGISLVNKEEQVVNTDGSVKWNLITKVPIKDQNGEVTGLVGIGRDISRLKRNELEASVLHSIIESAVTSRDLDELLKKIHVSLGKLVYAENIFVALYDSESGLFSFPYFRDKYDPPPSPSTFGKSCTSFVFNSGAPLLLKPEIFEDLKKEGKVELIGSPSPSWVGVPLKTPGGTIGVIVLQHYEKENIYSPNDVRFLSSVSGQIAMAIERKKSEEDIRNKNELLQTINSEKDRFFSIIAHDLRAPLSSFVTATQILIDDIKDMSAEELIEIATAMKDDASNVYKLLENLLEWSRLQRGVMDFSPAEFNLAGMISESLSAINDMAMQKEISIEIHIPEQITAYADKHMFETILRNLVSNAIKFTNPGGHIVISARTEQGKPLKIRVKDDGIGMPDKIKDKLFLINEATSRKGTGGEASSGLGLILIKEFVERHNGTISVESEEGKGSTFEFTLSPD